MKYNPSASDDKRKEKRRAPVLRIDIEKLTETESFKKEA